MARFGGPPHPNALAARMTKRAQRLATNKVAVRQRERKVLALRAAGLTWQEIGERLSISRQRAHQIGERAAAR